MISKNFSEVEWQCKCGCGQMIIVSELVNMMQTFRDEINLPITIHCVNRCRKHNKEIGGADDDDKISLHVTGQACDFHVPKMNMNELHANVLACDIFTGGIGLYDWGCHADVGHKRFWNKR
jgi:uncharacterized protein YcbK (DUF882 family)